MLGGMLSGHDQSGGDVIERDGKKFKLFYGMSSATAMNKHVGGVSEYRSATRFNFKYFLLMILREKITFNTELQREKLLRFRTAEM